MIFKSYEINQKKKIFSKYNFYLLYGENFGLKKDIKEIIKNSAAQKDDDVEVLSIYENEIISKEENFYDFIYSGSLFGNKKIITIYDTTDKVISKIEDIYEKYGV